MRGKTLEQLVNEAQANVGRITADALYTAVEKSERIIILDIRDKELYDAGHLAGAVSLPRAAVELDIDVIVLDQDTRIVTYCGGNTRTLRLTPLPVGLNRLTFLYFGAITLNVFQWN